MKPIPKPWDSLLTYTLKSASNMFLKQIFPSMPILRAEKNVVYLISGNSKVNVDSNEKEIDYFCITNEL